MTGAPVNVQAGALLAVSDAPQSAAFQRVARAAAEAGLEQHLASEADGVATLKAWLANERPPAILLLMPDLASPLALARQAYRLAPFVHIVFLVAGEGGSDVQRELSLAPMIGNHWSQVNADADDLPAALSKAARSTRQRRQLRTTLDRINLKLSAQPPVDSGDYRQLVVSDRYLASILEHAQDAVISVDDRSGVASWNRGAAQLFGYTEGEVVGRPVATLVVERQADALNALLRTARSGTPVVQREMLCRRANGSTFDVEVTLAPVRDELGQVIAVSATARDISERKQSEAEIRALNAELEQRVSQRTAQLEASLKELETFSYSVSHDLRSPLRAVAGYSSALLEDYGLGQALDETAQHYLRRIHAAAERMGELIDDLLSLARLGRTSLHRSEVDLGALALAVAEQFQENHPERRVSFDVQEALYAHGDPRLLRIALENLLGNAWKFTRHQEAARVSLGVRELGGRAVYFVRDNGAGFDMQYADKLFLPFQRLHAPGQFEGNGVGLATVQRIIQSHGGDIWAESEPGRGATFYFTLPLQGDSGRKT